MSTDAKQVAVMTKAERAELAVAVLAARVKLESQRARIRAAERLLAELEELEECQPPG
jgi:hypothetical protein